MSVRALAVTGFPSARARRVVGVVPAVDRGLQRLDRLAALLERWAIWCEQYRVHLGYRKQVAGVVTGGSDIPRSIDQADRNERWRCEIIDSAVDDLPPAQRTAILQRYGLLPQAVRFTRMSEAEVLQAAHEALIVALQKKGVDIG